jgi:hypothetical protein
MSIQRIIKNLVPVSIWAIAKKIWLKSKSKQSAAILVGDGDRKRPGGRAVSYLVFRGLANRMRAHIIAQDYAIRSERSLSVYWQENEECGASFTDLFVWNGPEAISNKDICFIGYDYELDQSTANLVDTIVNETVVLDINWQFINRFAFEKRLLAGVDAAREYLIPRDDILNEVNHFAANWPTSMIGVHIRRGDFVNIADQAIEMERYANAIRESIKTMPADTGIFIATDAQPQEIATLNEEFTGQIRMRPNLQRDSKLGVRSALIDMLLLSRTNYLVLTPLSTFGEMAAFLKNVPFKYA